MALWACLVPSFFFYLKNTDLTFEIVNYIVFKTVPLLEMGGKDRGEMGGKGQRRDGWQGTEERWVLGFLFFF
jgi:hypothetical protein